MVLIAGEPEATQQRCLAAIATQTLRPLRTILVRDRTPFHAAFEAGLAAVDTALLWQVDVDMVPDPDCLTVLRGAMHPGAAMSLAYLDDPMLGPEHGIKLFNVAALRAHPLPAGLTAETLQVEALIAGGYELVEARRARSAYGHPPQTLGRHLPDYSDDAIVCARFRRIGAKVHERAAHTNIGAYLDRLARVGHSQRHLAMLAFADGLIAGPSGNGHLPTGNSVLPKLIARLRGSGVDSRFPVTQRIVDL